MPFSLKVPGMIVIRVILKVKNKKVANRRLLRSYSRSMSVVMEVRAGTMVATHHAIPFWTKFFISYLRKKMAVDSIVPHRLAGRFLEQVLIIYTCSMAPWLTLRSTCNYRSCHIFAHPAL